MILGSDLAFAQARAQARHGARAPDSTWRVLSTTAAFRGFLEQARTTALRPWLQNISPIAREHDIERLLRATLHARIDDVAGWVPMRLRTAVRWTAVLVDLPALDHLLHGDRPAPWMRDEPLLQSVAAAETSRRWAALADGPLAPLARGGVGQTLIERWLFEWRRRLPALRRDQQAHLEQLVQRVNALRTASGGSVGEKAASESAVWIRDFSTSMVFEFRRRFLEPSAIFAHVLLDAIDYARVRGALLSRVLFVEEAH